MTESQVQRRQQAVARYLDGDKIDDICEQMACSRSWLDKWKNRYQPDDPTWEQAHSRRPARHRAQTPAHIEQAIRALRQTFEQSGEPVGAAAIQAALHQQGLEPVPSARTIYRILRRAAREDASRAEELKRQVITGKTAREIRAEQPLISPRIDSLQQGESM